MHNSIIFECEIAQAEINSDNWNHSQIARLDQAHYRKRSLNVHRSTHLEHLVTQLESGAHRC